MRGFALWALLLISLVGCSHPDIWSKSITTYADGTSRVVKTLIRAPEYAADDSRVSVSTNGVVAWVSASQSATAVEAAKADGMSKKIVYGGLALLMILGAIALALPNSVVSNKDALIIIGCGIIGFAVFRFVESAAPAMGIVIPILVLAGGGYLFWQWHLSNNQD